MVAFGWMSGFFPQICRDRIAMPRLFTCSIVIALAVLVSACNNAGNSFSAATEGDLQARAEAASATPRFQGGEKIKITVFNEPSVSGDYDVDPSGVVSLPLAGTVQAVGLTQPELEQQLAKKFKSEYLRNPKVTVAVLQFRPIYIVGEVEKQGEHPYKSGLNALTALALAGGGTYRANRNYVLIQHFGEGGMKEYPLSSATQILPGDLIRVPERYF
jgi:protein involved in polysaccharide export with SLBB domain